MKPLNTRKINQLYHQLTEGKLTAEAIAENADVDLNVPSTVSGDTLLKAAIQDDLTDTAFALIAAGADPDFSKDGLSPVEYAELYKKPELATSMRRAKMRYLSLSQPTV